MNDLKILVIDDKEENIETAKQLIDSWNNNGDFINQPYTRVQLKNGWTDASLMDQIKDKLEKPPLIKFCPNYVYDGKSALEALNQNNFQVVMSDIFFHFENNKTPKSVKDKIINIIGNHIHGYENESSEWMEGDETPPMGVLIAQEVMKNNSKTIMILNTFIYHHADLGEPISRWSREKKVEYIDSNARYLRKNIKKEQDVDQLDILSVSKYKYMDYIAKDWRDAFLKVILKL